MDKAFWKNKKILITGGTSFVGKNLQNLLSSLKVHWFVFSSDEYDLTIGHQADEAFQKESLEYDFIFHMAALQNAADWPMYHTGAQFYVNNLIHINALEAWKNHQPKAKFVAIGSTCCYPGAIPRLAETDFDEGALHESVYAYGFTKKLVKVGIEAYKDQYGLRGTMPMFATLYGPHDDFNIETAHVVAALIGKFVQAKRNKLDSVEVWGDGTQTRELIFVEDQLVGLLLAAQHVDGPVINIGAGEETTIRELAETIQTESGFKGEIVYNPDKFVGVKHKVLDIELAKKSLGWTVDNKLHTLEEGIVKTVAWYEDNY